MVSEILRDGAEWSPEVERAMRTVPRHAFLQEVPIEVAYRDQAVLLKRDDAGMPL